MHFEEMDRLSVKNDGQSKQKSSVMVLDAIKFQQHTIELSIEQFPHISHVSFAQLQLHKIPFDFV